MKFFYLVPILALLISNVTQASAEESKRIFICDCVAAEGCPCTEESKLLMSEMATQWNEEDGVILFVKRGTIKPLPAKGYEDFLETQDDNKVVTAAKKSSKPNIIDILGCEIEVKVEVKCNKD